jgi:hypothetical protein
MKPTARHLLIAVIALALGAIPAIALAQSPFRDYKQAAADQYGTGTTSTPVVEGAVTATTPVVTATVGATVGEETQAPAEGQENGNPSGAHGNPSAANGPGTSSAQPNTAGPGDNGLLNFIRSRYGVVGLSPLLDVALPDVVAALGRSAYMAEIKEPLDAATIKKVTDGTKWEGADTDLDKLRSYAKALGAALPDAKPLAKKDFPQLAKLPDVLDTWSAQEIEPVAGIVFTHVPVSLKGDEDTRRDAFVKAFIDGLQTVEIPDVTGGEIDLPLVGVERKDTKPSTIAFFKARDVSTVDDVDTDDGKLSLVRVLDGAVGHFGVKDSATDGEVAKPSGKPAPLLYRPTGNYVPGDLIRDNGGGIPGGGVTIAVLLLLGLAGTFSLLTIVERRTRKVRRARTRV